MEQLFEHFVYIRKILDSVPLTSLIRIVVLTNLCKATWRHFARQLKELEDLKERVTMFQTNQPPGPCFTCINQERAESFRNLMRLSF